MNLAAMFSTTIGVLDSPFGPHLDADLFACPYAGSVLVVRGLPNSATLFQWVVEAWGSAILETPLDLDPYTDLGFSSTSVTSCGRFNKWFGVTTDCDSTEDYPIIWGGYQWDPTVEARRINMAVHHGQVSKLIQQVPDEFMRLPLDCKFVTPILVEDNSWQYVNTCKLLTLVICTFSADNTQAHLT
jgi:hypothetical protein